MATLKKLTADFATGADGVAIPANEALPIYIATKAGPDGKMVLRRVMTSVKTVATESKSGTVTRESDSDLRRPGRRGAKRHPAIILIPSPK